MRFRSLVLAYFLVNSLAWAQRASSSLAIVNDTIYVNKEFAGYISIESDKRIANIYTWLYLSDLKYSKNASKFFDDVKVREDLLLTFNPENQFIYDYLGQKVGSYEPLGLPFTIRINVFTDKYSRSQFVGSWKNSSAKRFTLFTFFKIDKDKMIKLRAERERIKLQKERQKTALKRKRIEQFNAFIVSKLDQELDPIEGVFKSIDNNEGFEYDIAIFKSTSNTREYESFILSSTDPSMKVGANLFTFTKTAQKNTFFVGYQLKSGEVLENKAASLNGAFLEMGIKSFIKMYPIEGERRNYAEINPLFDWESSGSGVLINNEGYIVTNNHVAAGAKTIRIAFQNDSTDYNAIIISQNEATDVAILKIEDDRFESNIEPVNWETDFNLGQKVFTLGYPISNKMSNNVKVVDGIVSGENGVGGSPVYFQTTLPVWYGNSGGPCFNSKGEILGLATQILWDKGAKVDNVAYITKTENILSLGGDIIENKSETNEDKDLEQLIEELIPYSVFIKVNY
jgi:S1-C subfamily serine protease